MTREREFRPGVDGLETRIAPTTAVASPVTVQDGTPGVGGETPTLVGGERNPTDPGYSPGLGGSPEPSIAPPGITGD